MMDPGRPKRLLSKLQADDPAFERFGAQAHHYQLFPPLAEADVAAFEASRRIRLPEDYRRFITTIGNGGAGPFYGVFPLGMMDGTPDGFQPWTEGVDFGILAKPFPHRSAWNLPESRLGSPEDLSDDDLDKYFEGRDAEYYAPSLTDGAMPICHEGCALRVFLVVTGPEAGNLWLDYRADDRGILPLETETKHRHTFEAWYLDWLEDGA